MKLRILWILLLLLLAGCGSFGVASQRGVSVPAMPANSGPTNLTTAVVTLAPETTEIVTLAAPAAGPTPAPSSTAAQSVKPGGCAYPAGGSCATPTAQPPTGAYPPPGGYPAPGGTLATPAALDLAAEPFHDCARTPAITGCGAQAPQINARLAFYDADSARLVELDLQTGQGWQVRLPAAPGWLDWSAGGGKLLAALDDAQYAIFGADGRLVETFTSETPPSWQPGNLLAKNGAVFSADGWRASLVQSEDLRWELHYQHAAEAEQVLPLTSQSSDVVYSLRGWVPGTRLVLLQSYFASNSAMLFGGQLVLVDTAAAAPAAIKPLGVTAPLDPAAFAWQPLPPGSTEAPLLAFLATGEPEGARHLALYDFKTAMLHYPVPEGVLAADPAWSADGSRLVFAVTGLAADAPPRVKNAFAPGIYTLDPTSGAAELLTPGDGWAHFTPDGSLLIYARRLPLQSGEPGLQVRARRMVDEQEWVLVEGIPAPDTAMGELTWRRVLALGQ